MTTEHLGTTVLSQERCLDLLGGETVGRLAVCLRDDPEIFPLNYVVDRGGIVFRTAAGTKLAASVLGRSVAFEIDGVDLDAGEAWSVILKGQAVELDGMSDLLDALELPLFPGTPARSTTSCASNPSRSAGGGSRSSTRGRVPNGAVTR